MDIRVLGGDDELIMRRVGFRELRDVGREWLGTGDVRVRVVATRSREEAGKDRPLPPGAFDLVTGDEYENGRLVKKGGNRLYLPPGKPIEGAPWVLPAKEPNRGTRCAPSSREQPRKDKQPPVEASWYGQG